MKTSRNTSEDLDVLIVGAGFSGIYMLYNLLKSGLKVLAVDEASGVGGTWYWNRYPGARCDGESMEYSYSFSEELQQEWKWEDRYSSQSQILEYINYVADKFDLRRFIQFNSKVQSLYYDETTNGWLITTDSEQTYFARYCIMATGTLSSVNKPSFEGLDTYKGESYLTGRWPKHEVNFKNKTVGVIGTGSSGVQTIPVIATQAKHLTVFQRTPNYSVPAMNRPLGDDEIRNIKENYSYIRKKARNSEAGVAYPEDGTLKALEVSKDERDHEFQKRWTRGGVDFIASFVDIMTNESANDSAADFVRSKIRNIVDDEKIAELLTPQDIIGCKRLCADTDYYATYNRENVALIDLSSTPILRFVENGIQTSKETFELDAVVFAMGFDAMTGALLGIDIKGKSGMSLKDKWVNGPRNYLGISVAGFPNMFTITGPGSPSVLTNMMTAIEQHIEWVTDCITFMESSGKKEIEASLDAEKSWMDHVEEVALTTLNYGCNSWYLGANIPGKNRIFMPYAGGIPAYTQKCQDVASSGYSGFNLT